MPTRRSQHNIKDDLMAVRLDQLVLMNDLQVRVQLNPQMVREYAQIFRDVPEEQCTCPAITVYMHNGSYVVADGFHRVTGARQAGRTTLNAYIRQGTLDEAWVDAVTINLKHGMQYTVADRRKIVNWFLDHPRYSKLSTRDIAKLTGNMIPHSTVAHIKNSRKLRDLQDLSNLDEESPRVPSVHEQLRQVDRAYSRMKDAAALIIGVAQQMSDAPPALAPCVLAVQESVARLATVLEEMQDVEDGDE